MRRCLAGLILFFVLAISSMGFCAPLQAEEVDRGIRIVPKSGESLCLYKGYYALVVGVSEYDQWPDLPNAANDAREVSSALESLEVKVRLLLDPTSRQLSDALKEVTFHIGQEQNLALLLYFAGHGETLELADGTELGYIIPKDCPLKQPDPAGFDDKAISMTEIESLALKVKSTHVLMVFDSCFSGSLFNLLRAAPVDITEKSAKPVRQFITAGSAGEQVPDRSVFKIVFLDGIKGYADLNGDGYVTGSELGMHIQDKVVNYTRGGQHPQYGKINNPRLDKGDFVFRVAGAGPILEEPGKGSISIESNVDGAMVFLDGQELGLTPFADAKLSAGEHRIEVAKEGYEFYQRSIQIETGLSLRIYADLREVTPGTGQLSLDKESEAEKDKLFTNTIGMKFALISPGTFTMGSPQDEKERDSDERQHLVTLRKAFYIQTTEVTQDQWKKVMGKNPSHFQNCGDNCPVEMVSWNDAQRFIRELNQIEGTDKYRLPTEAEWEYTCRTGTTTTFYTGDCISTKQANYNGRQPLNRCPKGTYRKNPTVIGAFPPNPWGLYLMHGNVWEWCQDWYGEYPSHHVTDPGGASSGDTRVLRGGSWFSPAKDLRSACRGRYDPNSCDDDIGFRLLRDP
jgi:formylglycine-generating enzyme required for sulfatase activity